jgi:hypothetical protein
MRRNVVIELTRKGVEAVSLNVRPDERDEGFRFLGEVLPAIRTLDYVARGTDGSKEHRCAEDPQS